MFLGRALPRIECEQTSEDFMYRIEITSANSVKLKNKTTTKTLEIAIIDGAKKKSVDECRIVAQRFDLLWRRIAIFVAAVGTFAACCLLCEPDFISDETLRLTKRRENAALSELRPQTPSMTRYSMRVAARACYVSTDENRVDFRATRNISLENCRRKHDHTFEASFLLLFLKSVN